MPLDRYLFSASTTFSGFFHDYFFVLVIKQAAQLAPSASSPAQVSLIIYTRNTRKTTSASAGWPLHAKSATLISESLFSASASAGAGSASSCVPGCRILFFFLVALLGAQLDTTIWNIEIVYFLKPCYPAKIQEILCRIFADFPEFLRIW